MDTFKNYQYIAYFNHNNPHQYISLNEILKHATKHNNWNITHTLSHLQVQVPT